MEEGVCNERTKRIEEKLQDHETRIDKLENTYTIMQKMDLRMENVEKSVEKIDKKLNENDTKKVNKLDKFVDYLFYTILGILLSFIAYKIGLQ